MLHNLKRTAMKKPVKSISELLTLMRNPEAKFFHDVCGKVYDLSIVTIYGMTFRYLLGEIKNENILYEI